MLSDLLRCKVKFFQIHLLIACCFMLSPLSAHHSAAMFDLNSEMVLEGKVTKYQFSNPHVWIHLEVVDDKGEATVWKIEALNPNALKRKGWKRTSFKPGDKVSITLYPAKSGQPKGGFVRAITADGSKLGRPLPDESNKDEFYDDL